MDGYCDRCDRSDHSDSSDHWKPGFNLIMVYFQYFKRKDCLHRIVRLNKCSNLVECVNFSDLSGATVGCL